MKMTCLFLLAAIFVPNPASAVSGQGVKALLQSLAGQKPETPKQGKLAESQKHAPYRAALGRDHTPAIKPGPIPVPVPVPFNKYASVGPCHRSVTQCTMVLGSEGLDGESFFRGKTLKLVSVYGLGGANDSYARLLARHIGKFIPGKPRIMVVNIPGRGGLRGTSHVYNVAKPDGLTIVQTTGAAAREQFLGARNIEPSESFDMSKFNWLGLVNGGPVAVAVHKESRTRTLEQWLNPTTEPLTFGCTGPRTLTCSILLAISNVFAETTEVVPGYVLNSKIHEALRKGDVDGMVWRELGNVRYSSLIARGDAKVLAYIGVERHPEFDKRNVPFLMEYVSSSKNSAVLNLLLLPASMPYAWAAPPNTPQHRVEMLRAAFEATLKDAAFLADAERMGLPVNHKGPEWLTGLIADMKRQTTTELVSHAERLQRQRKQGRKAGGEPAEKPRPAVPPSFLNDPCTDSGLYEPLKPHRPFSRPCV